MTRQELIEDIKRCAPHIAKIAGENFNWDRVAEMVENDGQMVRTHKILQFDNGEVMDEDLAVECIYMVYANKNNLPV